MSRDVKIIRGLPLCIGKPCFNMFRAMRLFVLCFMALILLSGQTCNGLSDLGEVVSELGREHLSFSVLAINLQGLQREYGDDSVPWEDRYGRIANWMATTKKIPDLIALQEVHGLSGDVKQYETLFTLITKIREQTNVSYRIAYLTVGPVPQGLRPTLWAGNALLYNPDRLNNKTFSPSRFVQSNFDDESTLGVHPRKSLPCQAPPETFKELCGLIDGDGLSWVSSYRDHEKGRWIGGPVFAWFELKSSPGSYIHIYNVHVRWEEQEPFEYIPQFQNLVKEMEKLHGDARLYPPVVLGDFNISHEDMKKEATQGMFKDFEIAGYVSRDVMGVLVGKQSAFPSKQPAYFEQLIAPEDVVDPATRGQTSCGRVGVLWSDHCAVFVQFSPVSGPTQSSQPLPPPPPPAPTAREACLKVCRAQRDTCMAGVARSGGPRPEGCVAILRYCESKCPQ